jgi:hypothetical protein
MMALHTIKAPRKVYREGRRKFFIGFDRTQPAEEGAELWRGVEPFDGLTVLNLKRGMG